MYSTLNSEQYIQSNNNKNIAWTQLKIGDGYIKRMRKGKGCINVQKKPSLSITENQQIMSNIYKSRNSNIHLWYRKTDGFQEIELMNWKALALVTRFSFRDRRVCTEPETLFVITRLVALFEM